MNFMMVRYTSGVSVIINMMAWGFERFPYHSFHCCLTQCPHLFRFFLIVDSLRTPFYDNTYNYCKQQKIIKFSLIYLFVSTLFRIFALEKTKDMATEISTYIHEGMELPFEDWSNTVHSFGDLASIIQTTHDAAQSSAVKAINRMQTMRNWLIGYYIIEFEQHGKDRAEYGTQLLKKLEERVNRKGLTTTMFKWARKFYRLYPQMAENLPALISTTVSCILSKQKCATVMHKLQSVEEEDYRQCVCIPL